MTISDSDFLQFLLVAKKSTYAASGGPVDLEEAQPVRPASHDLRFRQGDWTYLDTYLGGEAFIGEEAVWKGDVPVWGMNYYGWMLVDRVPEGFSDFLKLALRGVAEEAPFRGPSHYDDGSFVYSCRWEGDLARFHGSEAIAQDGEVIYQLLFHGGTVR
jgi:hypothetical protein